MPLPFTRDQFFEVFRAYNEAIGAAPLLLTALAIVLVAMAFSDYSWRHRCIAALLGLLWLWSGLVYHWGFFAAINPAARLFGALFVVQAVLLFVLGAFRGQWRFDPRRGPTAGLGWVLIVYALVVYPALGWLLGHGYPAGPSFGAPCPVTIFTLGVMLWVVSGATLGAIIIPVLWSVVGTSAAVTLGIPEDFALGASALIVIASMRRRRVSHFGDTPAVRRA